MIPLDQIGLVRELEVVHKQVGGYLIPYKFQPPCVRELEVLNDESSVSHSLSPLPM